MIIEIVDWGKHYENYRTRELRTMAWVPMPNRHDGDGYTTLLDHPSGAAHFGAWCALVEVASRCKIGSASVPRTGKHRDSEKYDHTEHPHGRGLLVRESGEPHDSASLERMTRIPKVVWDETLPRLVSIGWIRLIDTDVIPTPYRPSTDAAPIKYPMNGTERKEEKGGIHELRTSAGTERKRPPSSATPETKKGNPMIIDLMEIHKRATGVDLVIEEREMEQLLKIFRKHDGKAVVEAYRVCQAEKPGKPMGFFLDDFPVYFAKVGKKKQDDSATCPECKARLDLGYKHFPSCSRRPEEPDPAAVSDPGAQPQQRASTEPVDDFEDDVPGEPGDAEIF